MMGVEGLAKGGELCRRGIHLRAGRKAKEALAMWVRANGKRGVGA